MARPPMSKFISTMMTEAPFSRAAIAAGRPLAPAPMMTTSASRSQRIGSCACAGVAEMVAAAAPTAAPEVRKLRRSIDPGVWVSLRDCDILGVLPMVRLPAVFWQKLRRPSNQGQSALLAWASRVPSRSPRGDFVVGEWQCWPDGQGHDDATYAVWRGRNHRPLFPAAGQASGGLRAD